MAHPVCKIAFSAVTLLVVQQEDHPIHEIGVVGAGMVISPEQGADDLHVVSPADTIDTPSCLLQ